MNEPTTTDELVAMVKATLRPYGIVHVDQVLAWLQRQADITRAECLETEWANEQWEEVIRYEH